MTNRIELTELERKKLAEAAAQSYRTPLSWRPIETAPKDGTIIIGYEVKQDRIGVSLVSWHEGKSTKGWVQSVGAEIKDGKRVHDDNWKLIGLTVTHWMPLPDPPLSIYESQTRTHPDDLTGEIKKWK